MHLSRDWRGSRTLEGGGAEVLGVPLLEEQMLWVQVFSVDAHVVVFYYIFGQLWGLQGLVVLGRNRLGLEIEIMR
jgi:hypothetical protein